MSPNHDEEHVEELDEDEENMVDDLDAYIAERDKREPGFAALVEEQLRQRQAARARGEDPDAAAWEESE